MNADDADGITAFANCRMKSSALGPTVPRVCIANGRKTQLSFAHAAECFSVFCFSAVVMSDVEWIIVTSVTMHIGDV